MLGKLQFWQMVRLGLNAKINGSTPKQGCFNLKELSAHGDLKIYFRELHVKCVEVHNLPIICRYIPA